MDILRSQPRWTWFMLWGDPSELFRQGRQAPQIYGSEEVLTFDELPWVDSEPPYWIHYPILK